jgi:hypothetical protein
MRRIMLALAAGVLGLAMTGTAEAHGFRGGHGHRGYHRGYGVRFAGGYYYRGHAHPRWGRTVWSPVYHRYHYWDPCYRCYYYYVPASSCYYPVP